ncbi:CapA family protein, partial [Salinispora arenicola]|uniref:CapA family protein n=1 Tax=Salinispora arenicola TaxID=168697 RepID=UPI002079F641
HGVAPMRARTLYEPFQFDQPGAPPSVRTLPDESDLAALVANIGELRDQVDVLIVSLHWGLLFQRSRLADYQPVVAHAAIDAGVGDFALEINERWWRSFSREWFERAVQFYQALAPGQDMHEEGRNSMIVQLHIVDGRIDRVGFVPVTINDAREPVPYRADTENGRAVRAYLAQITAEAGIDTTFDVVDDEVLVRI